MKKATVAKKIGQRIARKLSKDDLDSCLNW